MFYQPPVLRIKLYFMIFLIVAHPNFSMVILISINHNQSVVYQSVHQKFEIRGATTKFVDAILKFRGYSTLKIMLTHRLIIVE